MKTIQGKQITRKQALAGLGNPADWQADSDALYAEFRRKPDRESRIISDWLALLQKIARSACLKQESNGRCICFACEAKRAIERSRN